MADKEDKPTKAEQKSMHVEIVRQMLTLASTGFGLVAALAWNSVISEFVNTNIKTWFPEGGLWSLFIYAAAITALAVFVTFQLTKILERLESK